MKQKYSLKGPNILRKTSGTIFKTLEKINDQQDDATNWLMRVLMWAEPNCSYLISELKMMIIIPIS